MKLSTRPDAERGGISTGELVKLRVRPIPDLSPPVIDSRTAMFQDPSPFIQGTLAIDFRGDYDRARDPEGPEYFGPQRALSRDLPEPEAWVRHIRPGPGRGDVRRASRPAGDPLDHSRGLLGGRSTQRRIGPPHRGRQACTRAPGQDLSTGRRRGRSLRRRRGQRTGPGAGHAPDRCRPPLGGQRAAGRLSPSDLAG